MNKKTHGVYIASDLRADWPELIGEFKEKSWALGFGGSISRLIAAIARGDVTLVQVSEPPATASRGGSIPVKMVGYLKEHGRGTVGEIADGIGENYFSVAQAAGRMMRRNELTREVRYAGRQPSGDNPWVYSLTN